MPILHQLWYANLPHQEEQFKAIYTEYITVYEEVLHQENVGEMLPRELQSKLIKPVQRMVQYHMLLEVLTFEIGREVTYRVIMY